MAVRSGFFPSGSYYGYANLYNSVELDAYGDDWINAASVWEATPSPGSVALATNWPVSVTPGVKTGHITSSYYDDFYNRVHVNPSAIDIGNLLSGQTRDVSVWNAHASSKALSSISESGTDDMTEAGIVAPTVLAALEERTYSITVGTKGPATIDAAYTFNFPAEAPVVQVTGRRVVVWPFLPQKAHKEELVWRTDILPSYNKEQRLALMAAPRQGLQYRFRMDPHQYSRAKALATGWAYRTYAIPVWAEATLVGAVASGATEVLFDTSSADYRADDVIVIWESDTHYEAIGCVSVLADRVTLKLPLASSFTNAYVVPLRFANTLSGVRFNRGAHEVIDAEAGFSVIVNKDLGASVGYPTYRGKDVMVDRMLIGGDTSEKIARTITVFDNGSGPIVVDVDNNWVTRSRPLSFEVTSKPALWSLRKWLHSRRGRQRAFWLPSWNKDLIITADVPGSAGYITVSSIGYSLYYGITDIMIQLKNGSRVFARLTAGADNGDGTETLAVEGTIATGFLASDVDYACFMSHVRFDADRISLTHGEAGVVTTTIACTEAPE